MRRKATSKVKAVAKRVLDSIAEDQPQKKPRSDVTSDEAPKPPTVPPPLWKLNQKFTGKPSPLLIGAAEYIKQETDMLYSDVHGRVEVVMTKVTHVAVYALD